MKQRFTLLALVTAALLVAGSSLSAQSARFGIGPKLGFYLGDGKLMLGVLAEFPISPELYIEPGIEVVTGIANTRRLIFDGNLRYAFPLRGLTIEPFVLAGVGLRSETATFNNATSSSTGFRLNIGGGVTFDSRSNLQPWGGLKITLLDQGRDDVLLQGGVNFYF